MVFTARERGRSHDVYGPYACIRPVIRAVRTRTRDVLARTARDYGPDSRVLSIFKPTARDYAPYSRVRPVITGRIVAVLMQTVRVHGSCQRLRPVLMRPARDHGRRWSGESGLTARQRFMSTGSGDSSDTHEWIVFQEDSIGVKPCHCRKEFVRTNDASSCKSPLLMFLL